jgi:hypothetical protein
MYSTERFARSDRRFPERDTRLGLQSIEDRPEPGRGFGMIRSGIVPETVWVSEGRDDHGGDPAQGFPRSCRIRRISRASSPKARRAVAISARRRRYHRQYSRINPDEAKKTRPTTASMPRRLHHPSSASAAPSKASTAAAITVRARETVGDTSSSANRTPSARHHDERTVGNQTGSRCGSRFIYELRAPELQDIV